MSARIDVEKPTIIVVAGRLNRRKRYGVKLARGPVSDPEAGEESEFVLSPDDLEKELQQSPARIREVDQRLYEVLGKQPAVSRALRRGLDTKYQPGTTRIAMYPIYLSCSRTAERFPWEMLWVNEERNFIALYVETVPSEQGASELVPVWPLARMAASVDAATRLKRFVQPYLKVTAMISAAGVDGEGEWNELHAALRPLREKVRLQILVGDDGLKQYIEETTEVDTAVEFVGEAGDFNQSYLYSKIQAFGPNLLHFLCHGSDFDGLHLEIASRSDWVRGRASGSVVIKASELAKFGQLPSIWLVTLNCCQSANVRGDVRSIARTLVEAGTPAVLAMREAITPNNASLLTKAFYTRVRTYLLPYLNTVDEEQTIPHYVWPRALQSARQSLLEAAAAAANRPGSVAAAMHGEWTLPVLYLHEGELVLEPRPSVAELSEADKAKRRAKISTLRIALEELDPEREKTTVREIWRTIREQEAALYGQDQ